MNNSANEQNASREWLQIGWYAFVLCMVVLILLVLSSDQAPQWIYQGF
ncbi:MAG: hypothetical protein ACOYYS_08445 [Chloroflexota bacterium]